MRWIDKMAEELGRKGRENWNQEDRESYQYIESYYAEQDWADSQE